MDALTADVADQLVETPARAGRRFATLKLSCDPRPEPDRPAAHSLLADAEAALSRKFLEIAKTECEAEVEPERVPDDFGRKPFAA